MISAISLAIFLLMSGFSQKGSARYMPDIELLNQDVKAKKILDGVSGRYLSGENLELTFQLAIKPAERPENIEKGKIIQSGKMFRIESGEQDIYCDAKTVWYFLKKRNEVQINDFDEDEDGDGGIVSPKSLLKQYESGEYEYLLINEKSVGAKKMAYIEFKPTDRFNDYSKIRLSIDISENKLDEIVAFGKDGSRYTMLILSENFKTSYNRDFFQFDSKKYPGIAVEDLRID